MAEEEGFAQPVTPASPLKAAVGLGKIGLCMQWVCSRVRSILHVQWSFIVTYICLCCILHTVQFTIAQVHLEIGPKLIRPARTHTSHIPPRPFSFLPLYRSSAVFFEHWANYAALSAALLHPLLLCFRPDTGAFWESVSPMRTTLFLLPRVRLFVCIIFAPPLFSLPCSN